MFTASLDVYFSYFDISAKKAQKGKYEKTTVKKDTIKAFDINKYIIKVYADE